MKIFLLVCCIVMIGFGVSLGDTIESITVYEITGYREAFQFSITDPRLTQKINILGSGGWDFSSLHAEWESNPWAEYYDLYFSDSTGNLDPKGKYLTIACVRYYAKYWEGDGNNIDAVSLDYSGGSHKWAQEVTNFTLNPMMPEWAAETDKILGIYDNHYTILGDGYTNITVGFGLNGPIISSTVPEPSLMVLLGISIASVIGLKRWWRG